MVASPQRALHGTRKQSKLKKLSRVLVENAAAMLLQFKFPVLFFFPGPLMKLAGFWKKKKTSKSPPGPGASTPEATSGTVGEQAR